MAERSAVNVLLATHSPTLTTGYGRVAAVLGGALRAAGYDVTAIGLGHDGRTHALPFDVLPCSLEPGSLDVAVSRRLTDTAAPSVDLLLTIGDPWMFPGLPDLRRPPGTRWLAYFPVDGAPLPRAWARWSNAVDVPVVFSTFARDLVAGATGRAPHLIPHGVDAAAFAPGDRAAAKRRVGVEGRFVVGTVAANQQRKNLPALVQAFARFAKDKPDAVLYLHTPVVGCWDLEELAEQYGITDQTRATLNLDPHHGPPDEVLATIYNSFDVFALPTMAEGFGLPILEAQSCGVPTLATDCSACPDLLPDPFQRVAVNSTLVMARNFEQAIANADDLAAKLDRLYRDPTLRHRLGASGRALALSMGWKGISDRFVHLVDATFPPGVGSHR